MKNNHPQSIATLVSPDFWFFQAKLCREFKIRYPDTKIHLYTGSQQGEKYIKDTFADGSYDSITIRNFQAQPRKENLSSDAVLAEGKKWEEYLGTPLTTLIMTNRVFGRGYSLGAYHYPRSPASEENDHLRIIDIFCDELSFWQKEMETKKVDLFINPGKVQAEICRKLNIYNRFYVSARYEDYYFWADDEFMLNPNFEKNFAGVKPNSVTPIVKEEGYVNDMVFRRDFFRKHGLSGFFTKTINRIKEFAIAHIKQDEARRGAYLSQAIRRDWRTFRDSRKMLEGRHITDFEVIKRNPFFFFPLQTEPEWTMQTQSPNFFSQLWAIALSAKALPCHATLAVKEHIYPLGMRPNNFYDQIVDFKNINMISAKIHGLKVMRDCVGVITINGTSGYEAAIMGVPVILLGDYTDYAFLDHVFHCPKGLGLEEAVQTVLSGNIDSDKAQIDGARLAESIIQSSFRSYNYSMLNREIVPDGMVDEALTHLIESLAQPKNLKSIA